VYGVHGQLRRLRVRGKLDRFKAVRQSENVWQVEPRPDRREFTKHKTLTERRHFRFRVRRSRTLIRRSLTILSGN